MFEVAEPVGEEVEEVGDEEGWAGGKADAYPLGDWGCVGHGVMLYLWVI